MDTTHTKAERISCEPKTKRTILEREAPIARRIRSSCVRCSKEDKPILICPNIETNSKLRTTIHIASFHGKTEVIKYLISNKSSKDKNGKTPYEVACDFQMADQSQKDIVRELLK